MNILIIGAGNIGTAMAAMISQNKEHRVTMLTSKPELWLPTLRFSSGTAGAWKESGRIQATGDWEEAFADAEMIFVTVPSFLKRKYVEKMHPYIKKGSILIFVPGCGGIEFFCNTLISQGVIVGGADRVPCVSRIQEYGKSVRLDWKQGIRYGCLQAGYTDQICGMLSEILSMKCSPVKNYLAVTLTPSNQVLHTSRLYALFGKIEKDQYFPGNILFYGEWDDTSSDYLLKCDEELQKICRALDQMDLSEVISLKIHYESDTIEKMTKKISSIVSLKNIESPMIQSENGSYQVDWDSRYFTEDFPFGLCILKGIGEICGVDTPFMDEMLQWYSTVAGKEYLIDGSWEGRDLQETHTPHRFGITTLEQFYDLYKQ